MREDELLAEASDAHVRPATPGFFEGFWREAEQRQRRAARRWRTIALVTATIAAAAIAAAGVMASARRASAPVVDQTWSCAASRGAGGYRVGIHASVHTPRSEAFLHVTMAQPAEPIQLGPSAFHIDTSTATVAWDARRCHRVTTPVVFGPHGLPSDNVYTTHFLGNFLGTCRTAAHVLIHAHVTFADGKAATAKLLLVDEPSQRPIFYAQWTPRRIADWERTSCAVRPW